jgi:hypothetical protein
MNAQSNAPRSVLLVTFAAFGCDVIGSVLRRARSDAPYLP